MQAWTSAMVAQLEQDVLHLDQCMFSDIAQMEAQYAMVSKSVLEMRARVAEKESEAAQELQQQQQRMKRWKSILICYFPREASEHDIKEAFSQYSDVESVFLVEKNGVPKCYGFVNYYTHEDAVQGLAATEQERIRFKDNRGLDWTVKAEWADGNGGRKSTTPSGRKPEPRRSRGKRMGRSPSSGSDSTTDTLGRTLSSDSQ
jgi:hypothetical protein